MKQTDLIVIKHYRSSNERYGCRIVQESDSGHLLFLSLDEHKVLEQMRLRPLSLDQFLAQSLSGDHQLSLRQAMLLLKKLYEADFLLGPSDRIRETAAKAQALEHQDIVSKVAAWQQHSVRWLHPEAFAFKLSTVNPVLARSVEKLHHPYVILSLLTISGFLAGYQNEALWLERKDQFLAPVTFLLVLFLGLVLWNTVTTMISALFIVSRDRRGAVLKLSLLGRILPLLSVDDRGVMLWASRDQVRLRMLPLTLNFFIGTVGLTSVRLLQLDGLFGLFLANFIWVAIYLNPLFDSHFTRLASGLLGIENFLARTKNFFARELLRGIVESKVAAAEKTDETVATWLVAAATLCFIWLYGVWVVASDFLLVFATIYVDAWVRFAAAHSLLASFRTLANLIASTLMVLSFSALTFYPLARFFTALSQNIWSATKLPVFKARRSLLDYQSNALNSNDAVLNFLRNIPIFSHLSESALTRLSKALRAKQYPKNATIIQQGEQGHAFFIVAVGEVHVMKDNSDGRREIVSALVPGDSFGEIALLENVVRTASVRAKKPAVMLMLSRRNFDAAFPEGSEERHLLTRTIRSMKLISDAQAFSHFTPQEARQLVKASSFVRFRAGEMFIRQGDAGDVAYLIENGTARVVRQDKEDTVAVISRGGLVGTIALVRETTRTASVIAETEILALRIPKAVFLDLCLANPVVGVIIQELVQQQLTELEAG